MRMLLVVLRLVLVVVACRGPRVPIPPTESDIVAKSHAFLESVDRGDVAGLPSQLGMNCVHF